VYGGTWRAAAVFLPTAAPLLLSAFCLLPSAYCLPPSPQLLSGEIIQLNHLAKLSRGVPKVEPRPRLPS